MYAADSKAGAATESHFDSISHANAPNKQAKLDASNEEATGTAGALPSQFAAAGPEGAHRHEVETLSSNINFILGFTLISEDDWVDTHFLQLREMGLWDINLRLASVLGSEPRPAHAAAWRQRTLHVSESLAIKLWKSYIYREVPDYSSSSSPPPSGRAADAGPDSGSSVTAFLMKQRSEAEIYTDSLHRVPSGSTQEHASTVPSSLAQYRAVPFETYEVWLPLLQGKIEALCKHLEVGDRDVDSGADDSARGARRDALPAVQAHSCKLCLPDESSALAAPLAPLIVELDALTAELHRMHRTCAASSADSSGAAPPLRGWVADLLLAVHLRLISVVRAYASLFRTRAQGFGHEKIIKLLESLSYVLLTWVNGAAKIVRGGGAGSGAGANSSMSPLAEGATGVALSAGDLQDLREVVCTRELDNWLDLLRHHLSDMQGRHNLGPHCRASLQRIQKEFACLLQQVDALNFR